MQLIKEAIEEFRSLYEAEFGEPLTYDEATIRAGEIVALYEELYTVLEKESATQQAEAPPP